MAYPISISVDIDRELTDSGLFNNNNQDSREDLNKISDNVVKDEDDSLFTRGNSNTNISSNLISQAERVVEPAAEVKQGLLSWFEHASLSKKQLITAAITGTISVIAVVGSTLASKTNQEGVLSHLKNNILTTLAAGAASFGTTLVLGGITTKQINVLLGIYKLNLTQYLKVI